MYVAFIFYTVKLFSCIGKYFNETLCREKYMPYDDAIVFA